MKANRTFARCASKDQHEEAGKAASKIADCPHPKGSNEYIKWMMGYFSK